MVKPEGETETRAQLFGETLPELPPTERLADVWQSLDYATHGMAGPTPFTWGEIAAFARMTGIRLHRSEASCLMDMSRSFCAELADTNPLRIAPMERPA